MKNVPLLKQKKINYTFETFSKHKPNIIVANLDRKLMISYKLLKFDPLRTSPFKK